MTHPLPATVEQRLHQIEQARRNLTAHNGLAGDMEVSALGGVERSWIERSWRRCLSQHGQRPDQRVAFDVIPAQAVRRVEEANHILLQAAKPVLDKLVRAIANSRYFAILTDAKGIVIDAAGQIDRGDRRAQVITRIGVDLSERAVGTTAIGAVLAELQPVWLHRGEHFFTDNGIYSCAGAPLLGPDGRCVGMLDLTGIDAPERPELKHLVAQSARSIENALALARPHALLLRMNWPGCALEGEADGLVCLDADGWVASVNAVARQMLAPLATGDTVPTHCSELFAMPWESFFDAMRLGKALEAPLWSGLVLQVLVQAPGHLVMRQAVPMVKQMPLRDLETALIRKAVDEARGNVMQAARVLGISRATVYRKLVGKKGL